MLKYQSNLKPLARHLRSNQTDVEQFLWSRLRRKQLDGVQFYRQRPIGRYIVDFYAPSVKLVIELDGAQHLEVDHATRDQQRDAYLDSVGLRVMRLNNFEVLQEIEGVLQVILEKIRNQKSPLSPSIN
jgi:very-short-patch-repair endonuclease